MEYIKRYKLILVALCLGVASFMISVYQEKTEEAEMSLLLTSSESGVQEVLTQENLDEIEQYGVENTSSGDLTNSREGQPLASAEVTGGGGIYFEEEISKVPVYLCGAVASPGVYFVESTAIVQEVLTLGGGFLEEADVNYVNLAEKIEANKKIYIPKKGEEIDKLAISYDNKSNQDLAQVKININQATQAELETLPGIGAVKAEAILKYRMQGQGFRQCEELKEISGIGEITYQKLEPFITVE